MPQPHLLEVRRVAPGAFELAGEFDIETVDTFETSIESMAEGGDDVAIDLGGLTFIDSTGVRGLIALGMRLDGRSVFLRGARSNVARTLAIAGIDGRAGIRIEP